MTKQAKIREGLKKLREELRSQCLFGNDDYVINTYLNYLHSQGVVIKVDRELPSLQPLRNKLKQWDGKDRGEPAVYEMYEQELLTTEGAQQDMLEAGYVAVESLI